MRQVVPRRPLGAASRKRIRPSTLLEGLEARQLLAAQVYDGALNGKIVYTHRRPRHQRHRTASTALGTPTAATTTRSSRTSATRTSSALTPTTPPRRRHRRRRCGRSGTRPTRSSSTTTTRRRHVHRLLVQQRPARSSTTRTTAPPPTPSATASPTSTPTETAVATYTPNIPAGRLLSRLHLGVRRHQPHDCSSTASTTPAARPRCASTTATSATAGSTSAPTTSTPAPRGNVEISNKSPEPATVVIADAIRFGNGMGDCRTARHGPVRAAPREDETALYWILPRHGHRACPASDYDDRRRRRRQHRRPADFAEWMNTRARSATAGCTSASTPTPPATARRGRADERRQQSGNTPNQTRLGDAHRQGDQRGHAGACGSASSSTTGRHARLRLRRRRDRLRRDQHRQHRQRVRRDDHRGRRSTTNAEDAALMRDPKVRDYARPGDVPGDARSTSTSFGGARRARSLPDAADATSARRPTPPATSRHLVRAPPTRTPTRIAPAPTARRDGLPRLRLAQRLRLRATRSRRRTSTSLTRRPPARSTATPTTSRSPPPTPAANRPASPSSARQERRRRRRRDQPHPHRQRLRPHRPTLSRTQRVTTTPAYDGSTGTSTASACATTTRFDYVVQAGEAIEAFTAGGARSASTRRRTSSVTNGTVNLANYHDRHLDQRRGIHRRRDVQRRRAVAASRTSSTPAGKLFVVRHRRSAGTSTRRPAPPPTPFYNNVSAPTTSPTTPAATPPPASRARSSTASPLTFDNGSQRPPTTSTTPDRINAVRRLDRRAELHRHGLRRRRDPVQPPAPPARASSTWASRSRRSPPPPTATW